MATGKARGDNLRFRGRPPGRPLLFGSGDVNQGREMEGTAARVQRTRRVRAHVRRRREHVASRHPERVRRILEPLPVEGSEPGRAEVLRGLQVLLVRGSGVRLGEPFPFGKPLQDLNVRGLETRRKVLPGGVLVDQSGLPEGTRKQQPNTSTGTAPGTVPHAAAGTAGSPLARGDSPGRRRRGSQAPAARRWGNLSGKYRTVRSGPSPNVRCGYSRVSRRLSR